MLEGIFKASVSGGIGLAGRARKKILNSENFLINILPVSNAIQYRGG